MGSRRLSEHYMYVLDLDTGFNTIFPENLGSVIHVWIQVSTNPWIIPFEGFQKLIIFPQNATNEEKFCLWIFFCKTIRLHNNYIRYFSIFGPTFSGRQKGCLHGVFWCAHKIIPQEKTENHTWESLRIFSFDIENYIVLYEVERLGYVFYGRLLLGPIQKPPVTWFLDVLKLSDVTNGFPLSNQILGPYEY